MQDDNLPGQNTAYTTLSQNVTNPPNASPPPPPTTTAVEDSSATTVAQFSANMEALLTTTQMDQV